MNKIKLLIIDDDDINIFIMIKTIEKTGYDVDMISKWDGKLALQYLKDLIANNEQLPDLIFVDINMPVMGGWEFLEQYEKLNIDKNIEMFMLSSSIYDIDMVKAKTFKVVKGFISKPLSIAHMSEIFEDLSECV